MSTHFLTPVPPADWRKRAACIGYDPELWFPNSKVYAPADTAVAVNVCNQTCPVRRRCLDFAIDNGIKHGIYGGRTPEQRTSIERRRKRFRWPPRRRGEGS